jgi:hypothetical protein
LARLTSPLDDDPFEHLQAAPLTLDDLKMDAHRVARLEAGQVGPQLALLE